MKLTQVLEHLMAGPLTCYDAARLYHVAWLPTLVSQLRRRGHPVVRCDPCKGVTAYRYDLEGLW